MQCQPLPLTFFFNVFLKSHLPRLSVIFASIWRARRCFFPESVGAMFAAALAAVAAPAVILLGEDHEALLVEIKVAGLQRQRFCPHAAKI